jgi:uroporphyrin-3 C-methyltransferase
MSDESARPQVRRSGRGLAAFAVLIALVALGVAGYPYYQRMAGSGATETVGELEALRVAQHRQAEELARLVADSSAFEARLTQQQSAGPDQAAAQPSNATPALPSALPERALKLGEAELLLQSANDRLLVTRDVRAALAMLGAAQSLVDQVDDQALADVRSALSREIAALRDVSGVDVDATYQRLQALARVIAQLPARGVKFTSAPAPSEPQGTPAASTGSLAWAKFLSLFEFRRQGTSVRPPLGPDQAAYLRLNLGLMVQTAELALMRNDADVYQQSLQSIRSWLDDYLDTGSQDVAGARAEIDQLLAIRLDRSVPDISSSLNALRRVLNPSSTTTPATAPVAATQPGENS